MNNDKVKLGVMISVELNAAIDEFTKNVNTLAEVLKKTDPNISTEIATTKGQIVEKILKKGIAELGSTFTELTGFDIQDKEAVLKEIELMKAETDEYKNLLPSEREYQEAIVKILNDLPEHKSTSKDMYKLLADCFRLSDTQLNATMPSNLTRNWHINRSQWARNSLKKNEILIEKAGHGVWQLRK